MSGMRLGHGGTDIDRVSFLFHELEVVHTLIASTSE